MSAVNALLASFPSPDRGVWHVGGIPIRAYALCIIVGIIVAIWWGDRRFVARGGAKGTVMDMAVFAVPFGLVGGRIYHVLTDWEKYFGTGADPVDALKIWQGGLGIWGAISFGAVGAWIFARRRGVPLTALADACAPGIVVAQAIGRLGNWFNQELYGGATTLPWGLEIFRRIDPATGEQDTLTGIADGGPAIAIVHPTFLYELLWNLGVALLVVLADRRFNLGRGRAFAVYVAGYTAGRFWIELMREDPATLVSGIRINVITSVVLFAAAIAYLFFVRGPRETLTPLDPAPDDVTSAATVASGADVDAVAEKAATGATSATSGAAATAADGSDVAAEGAAADPVTSDPTAEDPAATNDTRAADRAAVAADSDGGPADRDGGSADGAGADVHHGAAAAEDEPADGEAETDGKVETPEADAPRAADEAGTADPSDQARR